MSLLFHETPIITLNKLKKGSSNINTNTTEINNNKYQDWKLDLDVTEFDEPECLQVKIGQNNGFNFIIVECYREINKENNNGHPNLVQTRSYILPYNVEPSQVQCYLSKDGRNLIFLASNIHDRDTFIPVHIQDVDGSSTFVLR